MRLKGRFMRLQAVCADALRRRPLTDGARELEAARRVLYGRRCTHR